MRATHILSSLGNMLLVFGICLVVPYLFAYGFGEAHARMYLVSIASCLIVGGALKLAKRGAFELTTAESFAVVSGAWLACSLFGALPYVLILDIGLSDAFFETMSGLTTTGASIFSDIDALPKSILMWRSLTQWLGGMGIIVLMLAIFPMLGSAAGQIYAAEVPGPSSDRLRPKIKDSAKILWFVYLSMTIAEFLLLVIPTDMNWFDAICISFCTLSTGGFAPHTASVAFWDSYYIDMLVTLFMFLAGCNFMLHYRALKGDFKPFWANTEFRTYLAFTLAAMALVTWSVSFSDFGSFESLSEGFRYAAFNVVSILTTTGFGTADFNQWAPLAKFTLLILMLSGACAGSTSGGIKLIRIIISFKGMVHELLRTLFPSIIKHIKVEGAPVDKNIVRNITFFCLIYFTVLVLGTFVMTFSGLDLISAATASLACLSNIGPGLGEVGPAANYAGISDSGKWFLAGLMMIGRLEIYSVLILVLPTTWKR